MLSLFPPAFAQKMPKGDNKRNPDNPQSDTPRVIWNKASGKWIGQVHNPLKRTASGKKQREGTAVFVNEADCIAATNKLRKKINDE